MKRFIISTSAAVLFLSLAVSCKKDYLDKAPDDDLTLDKVFANRDYAQSFLSNIYASEPVERRMVDNDPNGNPFVGASDEMEQMYAPSFSNSINSGSWGPTTYTIDPWTANYVGIRKANLFIENIDKVPLDDVFTADARTRLKGEALFLRASCWREFQAKSLRAEDESLLERRLADCWDAVRASLSEAMVSADRLGTVLRRAGCPTTPEEIGLTPGFYASAVRNARFLRDRYTFLDLAAASGHPDVAAVT